VDAYKSPSTGSTQSDGEHKPSLLQTASSTSDHRSERLLIENGDMDQTSSSANIAAPPRKRIKHSCSSSPLQDSVDIKIADGVTATAHPVSAAAMVFTPAAATVTAPSLCLAQALPLSSRIIGTVWQPVQSQSTTTAVSTSDGITVGFLFLWHCLFFMSIVLVYFHLVTNIRTCNSEVVGSTHGQSTVMLHHKAHYVKT